MALSVDYIYKFCLRLIRKNQAGSLTSNEFADFWNDAQSSYQDDLLGRFQARSNGKTGMNIGVIQDETILQKLTPFITPVTLTVTAGQADKPQGFVYRMGMRINGYDAHKVNYNQIATMSQSVIDPPSASDNMYYFAEYEDYYVFYPSSVTSAILDCVKSPTDVVWGYTLDGDGRQVYDAATSVQPQWDSNSNREITKRMLKDIGVSFKDADFSNFGQSVITAGE